MNKEQTNIEQGMMNVEMRVVVETTSTFIIPCSSVQYSSVHLFNIHPFFVFFLL